MKLNIFDKKKVVKLSCGEGHCLAILNCPDNKKEVWSWGSNKLGQLGHGTSYSNNMPKAIKYFFELNNDKSEFQDISCGGFHSLCLYKYKEDLNWIENDFNKIIDVIKS